MTALAEPASPTQTSPSIGFDHLACWQRRAEIGLTRQQLGEQVGCHADHIKRVEYGTARPSLDLLCRIIVALDVEPCFLLHAGTDS